MARFGRAAVRLGRGEAAEEVKAEPAPGLEPAIKREPSDRRRQQQQQQQEQEQPMCVRSAKRRAVWVRRGPGCPRARRGGRGGC